MRTREQSCKPLGRAGHERPLSSLDDLLPESTTCHVPWGRWWNSTLDRLADSPLHKYLCRALWIPPSNGMASVVEIARACRFGSTSARGTRARGRLRAAGGVRKRGSHSAPPLRCRATNLLPPAGSLEERSLSPPLPCGPATTSLLRACRHAGRIMSMPAGALGRPAHRCGARRWALVQRALGSRLRRPCSRGRSSLVLYPREETSSRQRRCTPSSSPQTSLRRRSPRTRALACVLHPTPG